MEDQLRTVIYRNLYVFVYLCSLHLFISIHIGAIAAIEGAGDGGPPAHCAP